MDAEEFRQYCLSLGEVSEKMPFGRFSERYDSILAFYVRGHMFCFVDVDDFTYVNVKVSAEKKDELFQTRYSVGAPSNSTLKHWVKIGFGGDVPACEVLALVRDAFGIVDRQYAPRKRR